MSSVPEPIRRDADATEAIPGSESRRTVWLVSPAPWTKGGIAEVSRQILSSPLQETWNVVAMPTFVAGSALTRLWWGVRGLSSIALGLVARPPDLVHVKVASNSSFLRKWIVTVLCRLRGVPILIHVHGGGFDRYVAGLPAPGRKMARWMVDQSPVTLCLSENWADKLRAVFPGLSLEPLPNPVEIEQWAPLAESREFSSAETRAPVAVFLGDLVERKGVFDLLEAWGALGETFPQARLVLAGTGESEACRRRARELGIEDRVELPGWVGPEEKRELLRRADLFVLPSYTEGIPLSLLEAMAAGLPSIVTPVGGVPNAVSPDREALFVEPGDVSGLATGIVSVFGSPELARRLGDAALARARTFDTREYAARLDRLYRMTWESAREQRG